MTDGKILDLFFARSQEAISAVRDKYGGRLTRLSQTILGSRQDAEECVNDALLAAWNAIPPERPDPLLPWLYATVRNISLNRCRVNLAQKRGGGEIPAALEELEEVLAASGGVEEAVDQRELGRLLTRFLRRLPPRDRRLLLGRYFYGESWEELADRLDMTAHNCQVRASRLRKKLGDALRKEGVL